MNFLRTKESHSRALKKVGFESFLLSWWKFLEVKRDSLDSIFLRMETSPVVAGGGGFVVIVGFLVTVGSTVVVVSEIYKITICHGICQQCSCTE